MAEQIDVFDENTGAGYQNQQIDDATGTAQTSSATKGYAPADGTVLTKGSGANKETGVLRPVNTGNAATDFANTMYNNALSQHFMDPGLRDISLHENLLSGTGESKRGELDDFMTWDFGTTKFDTDPNTMTRAEVKADRADKAWNVPRAIATGFLASGVSTAGTVASWVTGLAAGVARTAGYAGTADRMQNEVNSYFSDLEQSMRNILPIYEKESEENAPAWTSLAWYTSPKRLQDFLAMFGFSIGAGLTFKAAALLGKGFQFGYAAFEGATAVDKYMGRNEGSEKDGWSWKSLLPLAFGLTAGIGQKFLPAPVRNKLGLLATAGASAAGEAEIEAFHAREDFIQNKSAALLQNCNARKAEIEQIYGAKMDQATSPDEIQAIREEWDTQNKIIDWQYTQGYNSIVKNSRAAGDITRLWNYPILMFSNAVMFGKSMLGGLKTFQTSGKVGYSEEFNQALRSAYAADKKASSLNFLSKARRGRRNEIKKDVEKQFISAKKPIFSTAKKLAARDYWRLAELPASEGTEEMTQGVASNAGKAYAEVASDNDYANLTNSIIAPGGKRRYFNVDLVNGSLSEFDEDEWVSRAPFGFERDEEGNLVFKGTQEDYYSQFHSPDERLAAYRHAESQFEAAMRSIPNTLSDPEMWYEFALGALMGAIGCPWARSARVSRSTGEKDANGNIVTEKHWRSPIFLQGGIWNEYKKMKTDRQRLGEMAEQINKTLTPESIRKMRANFDLMVHNSNYEQEKEKAAKAFFNNKQGDKFRYKNASDAELLKQIEVFQNIGQLDLFKHIVQSDLDLTTADELRALQAATTTTDEKGNKSGAYAEFDLTPVPENGSDVAKQKLEDQVNKMRDKIKRNTDEIISAIDTYADARAKLQAESENGLTDDQLNCLVWYGVRLGMFDRRTKEMFEQNKGQLDKLNEKMPAIIEEKRQALIKDKTNLQTLLEAEKDEKKKKEYEATLSGLEASIEALGDAETEWAQRWQDAQSEKDSLKRARILFAGNKKGDPIGTHGVKAPWYKFWSNNPWERRVKESMSPAAKRRAALMGVNLDWMGIEGQTRQGVLDMIIADLRGENGESTSEVLSKAFSDQQEREKFADALDDMRECQAAVVRYKDFYQFYKDNPQAMTQRKQEEEQKLQQAAAAQERKEIADALKSAKTVAELYDKIVELLKEGKSLKDVNEALGEMVKEGNEVAKQLMKNQEFVRAFSSALNAIVNGEDYRTGALKPLLMAVAIDCAREAKSVDELRKAIEAKLAEVLATPESFYEYYKAQDFFGEKDEKKRMTLEGIKDAKMKRFQKDANGKYAQTGEEVSRLDLLRDLAPKMLSAIDNIIKEKQFLKEKYSFGESMSEEERALVSRDAAAATPVPTPTKATAAEMAGLVNPVIKEEKKEGEEEEKKEGEEETTESEASKEETKAKEEAKKRQEEIDKNRPQEPVEEDVVMSDDSDDTAEDVGRQEIDRQTTEDAPNNQKRTWWMDALSFFNIQKKSGEKKLVRNCFIKIAGKVNEIVKNIADSSFKDIWETYSKLNIFNFIDETPNAVKKGEPVYFIIDKIDPATGKSQIFGLNENELSYNGVPRVFMAVKRGNGYQAIGTLNTNKERQKAKGQDLFYETLLKESAKSDKAYVHKDTAKVGGVHSGLVETQSEENTLDKVFGGSDKVKVAVKTRTKGVYSNLDESEASLLDDSKMKPGRIYVLVKDNPTGKYVAMPCRVVHFGQKDQAAFGETKVWKKALAAIDNLVNAAMKVDESDPASIEAFDAAYTALGQILALQGYGVHIDVRKDPNTGKNKIILSKPKYKDGQPVFLTDKEGNPVYRKDKDGNDILDMDGSPIQAHDRDMLSFVIESAEQAKGVLLKDLLGDSFSVPFRVPLGAITKNGTALDDIINSGVITTNIVDGGGLCTRGGSVWVDVSGMQIVQDTSNNQGTQTQQTESTEPGVTTAPRVSQTIGKEIRTEFRVKGEFKFAFVLSPDGTLSLESRRGDNQSAVEWAFPINDTSLVKMVKDTMMRNNGVIDKEGISGIPLIGRDCVFFVKDENGNIALIEANKGQFRISNEWRSFGKDKTEAYEAYVNFLKTYERLDIANREAAKIDPSAKSSTQATSGILAETKADEIKERVMARFFLSNLIVPRIEAISKLDNPIGPEAVRIYKEIIKDLKNNGFNGIYENDIDNLDSHDMMVLYDIEKALTGETTLHSALAGVLDSFYAESDLNDTEESSEEDTTEQPQPSTQSQPSTQQESTNSEEQSSQQEQSPKQEAKQEKKEERKDEDNGKPMKKLESDDSDDISSSIDSGDDMWSVRRTSDALEEKIDLSKEIEAMRQIDPSLSRGDAILIIDGLIKTGKNGIVAQGLFRDGLIVLSTMAVRGTGFHELFHKIFDAALDEKTKREMLDDVKKINPKISTDSAAEEWLADAFKYYMLDQVYDNSWTARIKRFFRWLFRLSSYDYERISPVMRRVFTKARRGEYGKMLDSYDHKTLKESRIAEYKRLGFNEDAIDYLEQNHNSFYNQPIEVQQMLEERGWTAETFDILSVESRNEVLAC